MELPTLISDLALILLLAGIITIIFKKLNQPLVLGYIVAGFLVSSYCTIVPSVSDMTSIETWSEIGIIMMMFSLGLEFNLHKLLRVGGTAIITALVEIITLALLGYGVGQAMGWTHIESMFLGGMLSMSSTTIIIKAFDDLGMRGQKFTDSVFGVLIVEDIAGIFMMIMLTTISVSQSSNSGGDTALHLLTMLIYLALWLIVSIYLIPTFINRSKRLINDETLLIVSLGTCFGMVLLAEALGFSSALGAFLAGSIFAGTSQGERTEKVVTPVKNLFGAIFFISVGMMVQPAMIAKYWLPILIITLIVVFCKPFFSTVGMLLSGQPLRNSVHVGMSLAQIGEFSFIIASLGKSLGVIGDFIYPVIVSVSVVTTFTTPFFIKHGDTVYNKLEKILPQKVLKQLSRYTSDKRDEQEKEQDWHIFLKKNIAKILMFSAICIGLNIIGSQLLLPWLEGMIDTGWARIITVVILLASCSPVLHALLNLKDKYFVRLWTKSRSNRLPLTAFTILRYLIALSLVLLSFQLTFSFFSPWIALLALILLLAIGRSRLLTGSYLRVESRFLSNLNEKQLAENVDKNANHHWLDETLLVAKTTMPQNLDIIGKSLAELRWGAIYQINVIKIVRGKRHINIPEGNELIHAGDTLFAIGDKTQLDTWLLSIGAHDERQDHMPDLRTFINKQDKVAGHDQLFSYAIKVDRGMGLAYKSIRESGLKHRFNCILIGMERNMLPIINPNPDMVLRNGDLLWLLGTNKMGGKLLISDMIGEGENCPNSEEKPAESKLQEHDIPEEETDTKQASSEADK